MGITFILWMATGFYCCGLGSSKKKSKQKTEKNDKNGKATTNGKNGGNAITVAELEKVLSAQKKGENKDKAVKLLADHAKSGKALGKGFKILEGKTVSKQVVTETCKKTWH